MATIVVDTRQSSASRLRPLPLTAVQLHDRFFGPRLEQMRRVTIPSQYELLESTGRLQNFRRAAGPATGAFEGLFFNDSDVYKWLEAASFALATQPDPALQQTIDSVISTIAAAQDTDGYLDTYFTHERTGERWTDLTSKHELYCAGHLIQAAIAHYRATAQRSLLDVAIRLAGNICRVFGPAGRSGVDGHEEIEMALVELFRTTGDRRYLDQAGFFLNERGQDPPRLGRRAYLQDHLPVREQTEAVGHAVRLTYLACGMIDVASETGDTALLEAASRLWQSAFLRKAYITGGLGARYEGESFGEDFELPQERAYAETCAAIGAVMWNWRLLQSDPQARYADALERALYNGFLSGISLDGQAYFYVNPLADRGKHRRQPWFACACCPPNVARLLMSLPGYVASTSSEGLWLHLYARSTVSAPLTNGQRLSLTIDTDYPWDGPVRLTVEEAPVGEHSIILRIPSWCTAPQVSAPELSGNSKPQPGSYLTLRREWQRGDVIDLDLPMLPQRQVSHPRVLANTGQVAITRGPLVYCLEGIDHPGADVGDIALPDDAPLTSTPAPALLGGVVVVTAPASARPSAGWGERLYERLDVAPASPPRSVQITAIPYYAWANRQAGPMCVWLPRRARD